MKRVDRMTDELREEFALQMSLTGRLVKCRLRWARHLMRMEEERMTKSGWVEGAESEENGRSRLRWEDCVRRDISKVGVVGEWRVLPEDRGRWMSIMVKAGQKLGAIGPNPSSREEEEKNRTFYPSQP